MDNIKINWYLQIKMFYSYIFTLKFFIFFLVLTFFKNNIFYNKQILQKNKNNFEFYRKISSTTLILLVYKEYYKIIEDQ